MWNGKLFKRNGIYYAWIRGEKRSTKCRDVHAARKEAALLERRATDPDGQAKETTPLRSAFNQLVEAGAKTKGGRMAADTIAFYRKKAGVVLGCLQEMLGAEPLLSEVCPALVDDYVQQRRCDGAADSTIHKELVTWRRAMKIARRRRWWSGDLGEVFDVGVSGASVPRGRWLTFEEVGKLYEAMVRPIQSRTHGLSASKVADLKRRHALGENRVELARAFKISTSTMWRIVNNHHPPARTQGHELFAVVAFSIASSAENAALWRARREDIADDLSSVKVRGSKNVNRVDRVVPVELLPFALLLDFARRHADGVNGLFLNRENSFRNRLRAACDRAGIPHCSPNDLRRTHAKWLRLAGVAPAAIFPSMGHADSRMVERIYGKASALELAHVQRAQIAVATGSNLGGGGGAIGGAGGVGTAQRHPKAAISSDPTVPGHGVEPRTRGFSIRVNDEDPSAKPTNSGETGSNLGADQALRRAAMEALAEKDDELAQTLLGLLYAKRKKVVQLRKVK